MEMTAIPGYESYFVTREGKVFSAPNIHHSDLLELKLQKGRKGRQDDILRVRIPLDNKWYQVHKLVAEVLLPRPEDCNDVRHVDGNKENCSVDNLEWYFNPKLKELDRNTSGKAYSWSKWGGANLGLVQEDKEDEWSCQSCNEKQTSELPSYMFEFIENEFIRICSICQSLKLTNNLKSLQELLLFVRKRHDVWDSLAA